MSNLDQVRDGRLAHCYLLMPSATKVAAGSLKAGHFYYVKARGASSAVPEAYKTMKPFYCGSTAITVAEDDEVFELNAKFLSYANSKNLSYEKTTTDVTCDKDDSNNYVCDGSVNISGSINGYDLLEDGTAAIDEIRLRFRDILDTSGEEAVFKDAKLTVKDLLVFIWDAKDATTGTYVGMDFVPCFITTQTRDVAYQSGQTFNMDIQGCDSDDNGIKGQIQQAKWAGIVSDVDAA